MPDDTRPTFGQALETASAGAGGDTPATGTSTEIPAAPSTATESPSLSTSNVPSPGAPATVATQPAPGGGSTPQSQSTEEWDPSAGPLPYDRHKAILENTRTRAREEAQHAIQQQYGWALSVGPEHFQSITNLARQWANDPVSFVLGALDDLVGSPEYAPQLRSHVAKILASRPGGGTGQPRPAAQTEEPQPDIVVDGYSWYSAAKLAERDRWLSNQLLTQVRQELQPLREDIESRQSRDAIVAATQAANEFASRTLADMNKLPYFKEQKAEIERVFRSMPPMPDQQVGQAIRDAYIQVLATKVLPTLNSTAKSELLSSLNQKAAASARNPGNGSVAVAARPKSFEEALKQADASGRR
jgi:hypothetical protein